MANTNDYRNMSPQERYDRLERARDNSVKTRNPDMIDVNYNGDRFKLSAHKLKVAVVTTFLATAITFTAMGIGLGIGGTKLAENFEQGISVSDVLEEYDSIVSSNTHRTKYNDGVWYDNAGIARDILNTNDEKLAVYGVFKEMNWNRTKNLDEVMNWISIYKKDSGSKNIPDTWEDYLKEMGCVDEEGNISTKMYEEKMDNYALAVANMQKAQSSMKR